MTGVQTCALPISSVDAYFDAKTPAHLTAVVAMLRAVLAETAPDAAEVYRYSMACYTGRNILAWLIPTKRDVTLGFTYGTQFEDAYGLLRGVGKHARHVKVKRVDGVDPEALRYYIRQAVAFDAQ